MNELIENLFYRYSEDTPTGFTDVYGCKQMMSMVSQEDFAKAIETACKAQRNACLRKYRDSRFLEVADNDIKNAQIERQDYENN